MNLVRSARRRLWLAASVLAFTLAGTPRPAAAQENDLRTREARARAGRMVDEGIARFDAGEYRAALERFQAAYQVYPSPKIFLNIGETLRRMDRQPEAAEAYERFLAETSGNPEVREDKKRIARQALTEILPRIGRLWIDATLSGIDLRLDGKPVRLPAGRPLYVTAGWHELAAEASGYQPRSLTVELGAGEEKHVSLSLEPIVATPPGPTAGVTTTGPPSRGRVWTWVVAGGAGALLVGGVIFGALASSSYDDYKQSTPATYDALRDEVSSRATTANVLFVAAGAAAVTAGVLYYFEGRAPERPARAQARLELLPSPSGSGLALGLSGRF